MTAAARSVIGAIWDRRLCLVCITVAADLPPRGVADALGALSEAHLLITDHSGCGRCGRASFVFRASSLGDRSDDVADAEVAEVAISAA